MPSPSNFRTGPVLAALALVTALPASAQFQKPEDAIKYRKSVMFIQSQHLGRVGAMANGKVPFDAKVAAENIETIAAINHIQFTAFIEGTDKGETRAKPEIWTEKDKWAAAVTKNEQEVQKLVAAGKSGNLDQIKAAVGGVGQSCKGCHDTYRKE